MNSKLQIFLDRHGYQVDDIISKRIFTEQIFMGAGHPSDPQKDFTGQEQAVVHHLIDEAFSIISGMEQNGGMGTEFDEKHQARSQQKLEAIVENIKTALLGEQKEEPLAWIVYCPLGREFDYEIYTDENDAIVAADENNQNLRDSEDPYEVIPLYRRS
jgi:hypothetical protein